MTGSADETGTFHEDTIGRDHGGRPWGVFPIRGGRIKWKAESGNAETGGLTDLRHLDVMGVTEHAKGGEQPDHHADHDDNVEDLFDFAIHGNVGVDQPEDDADDDEGDEEINEGHRWLSIWVLILIDPYRLTSKAEGGNGVLTPEGAKTQPKGIYGHR